MTTDFQKDSLVFAQKCFDDVRAMSKDTTGVSRQGYSPVETKVLEYFKKIGVELNLEISTDKAGNVWMTVPGKNRELPALVSGSHADSVPQGGNYDGLAGHRRRSDRRPMVARNGLSARTRLYGSDDENGRKLLVWQMLCGFSRYDRPAH